jgi:hypothetical protein
MQRVTALDFAIRSKVNDAEYTSVTMQRAEDYLKFLRGSQKKLAKKKR